MGGVLRRSYPRCAPNCSLPRNIKPFPATSHNSQWEVAREMTQPQVAQLLAAESTMEKQHSKTRKGKSAGIPESQAPAHCFVCAGSPATGSLATGSPGYCAGSDASLASQLPEGKPAGKQRN